METKKKVNRRKLTAKQKEQLSQTTPQVPTHTTTGAAPATPTVKPAIGSQTSNGNLIIMGTKLVEAARLRELYLANGKWPKARTDALEQEVTEFAVASTLAKAESKRSTAAYQGQVRKSRGFRNRLAAKIRVAALAKPEVLEETPLYLGEMTNAVKLMQWFTTVQVPMQALRTELANESPDTDWFAQLQTETQALAQAMGAQEVRKSQRAARANERIAARNKLVLGIQTLYTRAHDVFVDSPLVLKEFSKWSFRKRKSAKPTQASGTSLGSGSTSSPAAGAAPGPQSATSTGMQTGPTAPAAPASATGAGAPAA